jgi:hypothetical protein
MPTVPLPAEERGDAEKQEGRASEPVQRMQKRLVLEAVTKLYKP